MFKLSETSQIKQLKTITCIPAFNEEESIGKVVSQSQQFVDEVAVVDDGSTDGTALAMAGFLSDPPVPNRRLG
ncbi:glycosyltransferase [Chloroflexota bacterium]